MKQFLTAPSVASLMRHSLVLLGYSAWQKQHESELADIALGIATIAPVVWGMIGAEVKARRERALGNVANLAIAKSESLLRETEVLKKQAAQ